jgi:hypothetical protein
LRGYVLVVERGVGVGGGQRAAAGDDVLGFKVPERDEVAPDLDLESTVP